MEKLQNDLIEVFKTDVTDIFQSEVLKYEILSKYPEVMVSFDLNDCDRILRMEGDFDLNEVIQMAKILGMNINPLED